MDKNTLQHFMFRVASETDDPWARGFARSIWGRCNSRYWEPSPKQLDVARRLIADLNRPREDVTLIDRGDV